MEESNNNDKIENSNEEENKNNYSKGYHNQKKKKKKNYNNNNYYGNKYYYGSSTYGYGNNYINNNYYKSKYNYNKFSNYSSKYNNDNNSKSKKNIEYYLNKIDQDKILIPELTQNLINELKKNKLSCLICELLIKNEQSIWECNKCYSILHLDCITEWIKKNNPNFNPESNDENAKLSFTCPHCKSPYELNEYPIYNCYCGKYYDAIEEKNKHLDIDLIPHGCGLLCKQKICPHIKSCPIPCHPGPHVQCKEKVKIFCYCKKKSKIVPCSFDSESDFCCNEICGKQLNCGKVNHLCKAVCHTGSCMKFLKKGKCYECMAECRDKLYNFLKNSVEKKLNRECYEAEHMTHFASCLTSYIFNGELPCKEHTIQINTDQCLKLLLRLFEVSGDCLLENLKKFIPICEQVVENSCACRNKKMKVSCFKLNYPEDILDFLGIVRENPIEKCNRICKTLKNCGIHKCDRICCNLRDMKIRNYSIQDPNGYHLCFKICGKLLSCGKHNCENYCHKGACKPCAYIIHEGEIKCTCGSTVKKAPYICGTILECNNPCSVKRPCGHPCPLKCHIGSCPPCEVLVEKKCRCGKKSFENIKCGDTKILLCNKICGCILPCGVHFCQIKCHDHTDEYDEKYICKMICNRKFIKCDHLCKKQCHGESECDEYACDEKIYWYCKCHINSKQVICGKHKQDKDKFEKEHPNEPYVIQCNNECIKTERLRNINEAFEGLKNISESKVKLLYPNCNIDGSEEVKRERPQKYHNDSIWMAIDNFDLFFEVEKELYKNISKAKKEKINKQKNNNETKEEKKEEKDEKEKSYLIPIEEEAFDDLNEWLVLYHGIKPKKVFVKDKVNNEKNYFIKLTLSQLQNFHYQKYRLSLIALLFKHNLFVSETKYLIYHPFKYSIEIISYKANKEFDELDRAIRNLDKIKYGEYYLYEYEKYKFYLHFFSKTSGQEIYNIMKNNPYDFNEVHEIQYNIDKEPTDSQLYKYLKDENYLNYLKNGTDKKYMSDENNFTEYYKKEKQNEEEEPAIDEDGFTIIKNKK